MPAAALAQDAVAAQEIVPPPPARTPNGLALTPPMGWNSWNKFACDVNEDLVRRTADAMAGSGMRAAGYEFLVIDDCWQGARDGHGDIQPDPQCLPSGMKALGDHIHSKAFKAGTYSDASRARRRSISALPVGRSTISVTGPISPDGASGAEGR